MKVFRLFLLLSAFHISSPAQRVDIYSAGDLSSASSALAAKGAPYADRDLARYANHYLLLIRRSQTGSAELHKQEADIFVAEGGTATLLFGGTIVNAHTTKAGEIRGSSIQGGERHRIAPGDVVHIPAGVPHQLLLEKGHPFSYFVVKITGQ